MVMSLELWQIAIRSTNLPLERILVKKLCKNRVAICIILYDSFPNSDYFSVIGGQEKNAMQKSREC